MVAAFILAEGRTPPCILLLRRTAGDSYAPGSRQILYGHIEDGESPEQTVVREIGEETGLIVKSLFTLNETFTFYEKVSKILSLVPVFVATVDDGEKLQLDPDEHIEAEWLELGEAREYLTWPAQKRALDVLSELMESGGLPEIMRLQLPNQVR
jgi:8-oxo-dGTP pyrophosphatase MutT (NUDIX family)